jgi:hypothetical protein
MRGQNSKKGRMAVQTKKNIEAPQLGRATSRQALPDLALPSPFEGGETLGLFSTAAGTARKTLG